MNRLNISLDDGESKNVHVEEEQPPQQELPLPPLVISRERKPQAPLMIAVPEQQDAVQGTSGEAVEETPSGTAVSEAMPKEASGETVSGAMPGEAVEEAASSPTTFAVAQPPQVLWISPTESTTGVGVVPLPPVALQVTGAGEDEDTDTLSQNVDAGANAEPDAAIGVVTVTVADEAPVRDVQPVAESVDMTEAPAGESEQGESEQGESEQDKPQKKKRKRRTKSSTKGRAKTRRGRTRRLFLVALRDMLIAVALLVLLLQFFSPTVVREHSMENTLKENEILYIARAAYWFGEPQHGDIVVFHITLPDGSGDGKTLVKRVIGVPGDRITISGGVVYRNDRPLDEAYVKGGMTLGDLNDLEVPEDSYFVLGDNREVSNDSRNADIGFVDKSQFRGKVMFRIFPLSEFRVF